VQLATQQNIGTILSTYDDLIETNSRRIAVLEETVRMIFEEWFVHFRFPGHETATTSPSGAAALPQGWRWVNYTDIIDVLSGGTPKTGFPEYWNGGIPWFTPGDIGRSWYVIDTERTISELGLVKCNSALYPAETVFITARGTVGRCVLCGVPMAMSQTSYALRGHERIPQAFVFLLTKHLGEVFKSKATGAVFDTIVVDTFRSQRVVAPDEALLHEFNAEIGIAEAQSQPWSRSTSSNGGGVDPGPKRAQPGGRQSRRLPPAQRRCSRHRFR
jgi:type I restriction enzyme S subunit